MRFNLNRQILSRLAITVNQLPETVVFLASRLVMAHLVESPYAGPVAETPITVAGRTIRLVHPVEPDRLLDDPNVLAWNQAEDYMPYWAYLWPGAFLLGEALTMGSFVPGTRALEIGCGLGLPGLVGVSIGLKVHFTDHDRTPLRFVEASARANGFDLSSYSTSLLDWRFPPEGRFPLILGADVTYEKRLIPLVAGVIAAMLEPDGQALITDPNRLVAETFADTVKALGLATEAIPAEGESEELGKYRGNIHRVWWPTGSR